MNVEQLIVCSVFALVVYGVGFYRGLKRGHELRGGK